MKSIHIRFLCGTHGTNHKQRQDAIALFQRAYEWGAHFKTLGHYRGDEEQAITMETVVAYDILDWLKPTKADRHKEANALGLQLATLLEQDSVPVIFADVDMVEARASDPGPITSDEKVHIEELLEELLRHP